MQVNFGVHPFFRVSIEDGNITLSEGELGLPNEQLYYYHRDHPVSLFCGFLVARLWPQYPPFISDHRRLQRVDPRRSQFFEGQHQLRSGEFRRQSFRLRATDCGCDENRETEGIRDEDLPAV